MKFARILSVAAAIANADSQPGKIIVTAQASNGSGIKSAAALRGKRAALAVPVLLRQWAAHQPHRRQRAPP